MSEQHHGVYWLPDSSLGKEGPEPDIDPSAIADIMPDFSGPEGPFFILPAAQEVERFDVFRIAKEPDPRQSIKKMLEVLGTLPTDPARLDGLEEALDRAEEFMRENYGVRKGQVGPTFKTKFYETREHWAAYDHVPIVALATAATDHFPVDHTKQTEIMVRAMVHHELASLQ